jgi:hypothetical protein
MTELLAPQRDTPGVADKEPPRPAGSPGSIRRVLVVVDEPCTASELCAGVRAYKGTEPFDAFVIAPAHDKRRAQWYIDEDAARADAIHRLRACISCLHREGIRVDGRLSDPDPVQAIADGLHVFPADEVLFVTAPQRPSTWLHQNVIDRARRSFDLPIRHVVMPLTEGRG